MRYFLPIILSLCVTLGVVAKDSNSQTDYPRAFLKVEYEEMHNNPLKWPDVSSSKRTKFILLIANGSSQYYDPQTFFVDSLKNDPTGKAALDALWEEAYDNMMRGGEVAFFYVEKRGFVRDSRYRNIKDFTTGIITAKNSDGGDRYRYPVEMADLQWELGDSIKTVMNYECQIAEADYHGRHWIAWFTPEIPIQDGPWQLCGLPGLILEAQTDDNEYSFEIKGIQQTDESFKPDFDEAKYYDTKRKSYWKMRDYSRRNRSAQIGAMTGGVVKLSEDVNYKGDIDYIETDFVE